MLRALSRQQAVFRRGGARAFVTSAEVYSNMVRAASDPATRDAYFLNAATKYVDWSKEPTKPVDLSRPSFSRWFTDGELNVSYNCLDRHVKAGRGSTVAMRYDSPTTGTKRAYTYAQLLDEVEKCAGVLRDACGVKTGDRVIVYMPMIPEAVITMLACARLGAPHSVVFGGFAPRELSIRIDDAKPAAIVTASCGVEPSRTVPYGPILDQALTMIKCDKPKLLSKKRVVPGHDAAEAHGALDWDAEMAKAKPVKQPVLVNSTHPLYVLYTSGTTGTPKGIVRDSGGYATAMGLSMDLLMRCGVGQTYFAASDLGWVVGHSYILYGPLIAGCTTVLYEGKPVGTPDAGAFWRLVHDYKIDALFCAPTALRAVRRQDPSAAEMKKYDTKSLKALYLAGERADPDTVNFYKDALGVPIVDAWWQTETGWPICGMQTDNVGVKPGSTSKPLPGFDVRVLDVEKGTTVPDNTMGMLAIKLPLPPGALTTVYNNDERYLSSYMKAYPGYYNTGDLGFRDDHGYITVMSRNDDLINVAGHRLSTGTIEQAISGHPAVAECACIGVADSLKGEVCLGMFVMNNNVDPSTAPQVEKELIQRVRDLVGPVASFHNCYAVKNLPKTRSGKVLRGVMKKIADGNKDWEKAVPGTIEDMGVLHAVADVLKARWKPS